VYILTVYIQSVYVQTSRTPCIPHPPHVEELYLSYTNNNGEGKSMGIFSR
jgi:hypothetical protein